MVLQTLSLTERDRSVKKYTSVATEMPGAEIRTTHRPGSLLGVKLRGVRFQRPGVWAPRRMSTFS
jgi:hypothetical protein